MLSFYDGDDGNGNNRYRSTGYEINPLDFSGWHNFAVVAAGKSEPTTTLMENLSEMLTVVSKVP